MSADVCGHISQYGNACNRVANHEGRHASHGYSARFKSNDKHGKANRSELLRVMFAYASAHMPKGWRPK